MQSPVELPTQNACKAYDQGDYKTAYRLFKLLAEQGNADAQSFLGIMYYEGQGVSQDYVETAMWYRKAAEQGLASAQCALRHMYEYGKGIPQEHAQVAKWFGKVTNMNSLLSRTTSGCRMRTLGNQTPTQRKRSSRYWTQRMFRPREW